MEYFIKFKLDVKALVPIFALCFFSFSVESLHWICLEVGCLGIEENGFSHLFFFFSPFWERLNIIKLNPFFFLVLK